MTQSIIDGLPQSAQDQIKTMRGDGCVYREIHEWLQFQGFGYVTLGMIKYYCRTHFGIQDPHGYIEPAKTFEDRLSQYVSAVLDAGTPIYTLNRIRLYGPIWGQCTLALKQAGLIEPDNSRGSRYRVLVSMDELREWQF